MWKDFTHHTQQEWQHHHKELRGAQFTITRRSRASAPNIVCASHNTEGTNQAKLQQRHCDETSTHALDSSTQRTHQQVCSSQQRTHKLLQQVEQRETHTTLRVWQTVQHMLPTVTQFPKLEPRFYNGIWLGKDTTTGESPIASYNKIVRARAIRRQIMPHKCKRQLLE